MFGKPIGKDERVPEDVVALKSLFGLRPGVYLAVLYSIFILAVLFAVLVLPGILNPGSLISFNSEPRGAAVRVDGVYVGATPCAVFVRSGPRSITFATPGFTEVTVEKDVGSRVFASLFFPRRDSASGQLTSDDPVSALALGASDFAAWTFAGEPTATYQVPLSLSDAAYRAAPAATDESIAAKMVGVLKASARFAAYGASHRDLLRAAFLVKSVGSAPSPISALRAGRSILDYLSETEGAAEWLALSLGSDAAAQVAASDWYAAMKERSSKLAAASRSGAAMRGSTGRRVSVGSLGFREIPAGIHTPSGSRPLTFARPILVPAFFIAEKEVDERSWSAFLAANPEWKAENREALKARGLVSDGYLEGTSDPAYPVPSMPGVSWHAAAAFCAWLSASLPPALSGYEIVLPSEIEWERAAAAASESLERMNGGLWEWCRDPYAPFDYLPAPPEAVSSVGSPERSVRGGSWVNAGSSVSIETRASLPGDSCSPFVGFRPAIVRKSEREATVGR